MSHAINHYNMLDYWSAIIIETSIFVHHWFFGDISTPDLQVESIFRCPGVPFFRDFVTLCDFFLKLPVWFRTN